MEAESPIPRLNQWSCSMDALCWSLEKLGHPRSHDQLILQYHADFPIWNLYKGYLGRWDILNLLSRMKFSFSGMLYSNQKEEILNVFNERKGYLMGFAFTGKPTNHTSPIVQMSADQIHLIGMEKDPSTLTDILWEDFLKLNDGQVMLLFR